MNSLHTVLRVSVSWTTVKGSIRKIISIGNDCIFNADVLLRLYKTQTLILLYREPKSAKFGRNSRPPVVRPSFKTEQLNWNLEHTVGAPILVLWPPKIRYSLVTHPSANGLRLSPLDGYGNVLNHSSWRLVLELQETCYKVKTKPRNTSCLAIWKSS